MSQTTPVPAIHRITPGHDCTPHGHYFDKLYPHSIYQCQNAECPKQGQYFRTGAFNGAVTWSCPDCYKPGHYVGRQCSYCTFVQEVEKDKPEVVKPEVVL